LVSKPLRRRLKSYSGSGRAPLLPAAPRHLAPTREWGESAEAGAAIGYAHIDVCELRVAQGKLFMFLVINRISKFTHAAFHEASTKLNGAAFLRQAVEVLPYRIRTVLTDNGMAFVDLPKYRGRYPEIEVIFGGHILPRLPPARYRAPAHQARPSLDQRPGRGSGLRRHARHHQGLPPP
jgi:hypothetical protein